MSLRNLSILLASSPLFLACGDEASVGSVCGADTACRSAAVEQTISLQTTRTLPSALTTLEPTWTKREELGLRDERNDRVWRAASRIATGERGGLWLFQSSATGVSAARLDAAANVLQTENITPPAGRRVHEEPSQGLGAVTNDARGPVLTVAWSGRCGSSSNCDEPEAVAFSVDAGVTKVQRVRPDDYFELAFRASDGQALVIPEQGYENAIRKIGFDGKTAWSRVLKESALDAVAGFEGDDPYDFESFYSFRTISAISPSGTLTLPIAAIDTRGSVDGQSEKPVGIVYVSAAGELKLVPHAANVLAAIGGSERAVAYDAGGGMYFVHSGPQGDLLAFHTDATGQTGGHRLIREGGHDLKIAEIAVDPAGTLFLSTNDDTPVLCRLPADGEGKCASIASVPHSMQAPAPDVVYALSRAGLQRYDLR